MSLKPILFMTAGLLMAGGAVFYANTLMPAPAPQAPVAALSAPVQTILIAAAVDIPFGTEIRSADLVPRTWPPRRPSTTRGYCSVPPDRRRAVPPSRSAPARC